MNKTIKSQTVTEYIILFALVIAALVTSSFIGKVKEGLAGHFDKSRDIVLNNDLDLPEIR